VRMRAWSEKVAREGTGGGRKVELPERLELGLDDDEVRGGREGRNGMEVSGLAGSAPNGQGNGNVDTIMAENGEPDGGVS